MNPRSTILYYKFSSFSLKLRDGGGASTSACPVRGRVSYPRKAGAGLATSLLIKYLGETTRD